MIKVEIWSDLNCPFCYIGKRHLEMALAQFQNSDKVLVEWKSFELDPMSSPSSRDDNTELLARKYGRSREWAEEMNKEMTAMANMACLDFHMDKIIPANSFNAHRLLHLAKSKSHKAQNDMKEILLSYKFIEGKNINSHECLREAGLAVGLESDVILAVLESDKFGQDVRKDEEQAEAMGITSVPHFRFNRIHIISGARPPDVFLKMLDECSRFEVGSSIEF
jgi:protein disulfide-isomerase